MSAAIMPIEIEQGGSFLMRFKFVKDGLSLPLQDIKFTGVIKNTLYDTEGFPFRFEVPENNVLDVYVDAHVTESMDFTKGVYEIKMIQVDGFNTPLLRGPVSITLGASDETGYN